MTIKASKFTKFKNKINSKLIGNYDSDTGLGTNLIIKKYTYELNKYGEEELTYVSQETCKGIIINSTDFDLTLNQGISIGVNDVRMLIPIEYTIDDNGTNHYEFLLNSKTYVLTYSNAIGQVSNLAGVVREILITPKID